MIDFVNTDGGVRDVKLIRPGYPTDTEQVFTDEFLQALEPFSTIRFMDWLATNQQNSYSQDPWYSMNPLTWEQRKQPNHASQAATYGPARGVAWEYIIELGNATGKDIWINIPIQADDAYIAALAKLLHETLSPELTVYVEYSNEVWNWSFPQAGYNMERGKSEEKIVNYVKEKKLEGSEWALQYANRTAQIADIFRAEYGADAMNKQVCAVLAWQFGWDPVWFFTEMLQFIQQEYGAPEEYIYTLSIAPYFSEPLPEDCTDVDTILTYMQSSSNESAAGRQKVIDLAKAYKLPGKVSCYEGGPHHQGQVETNLATRMEAHKSAAMEHIVTEDITTNFKNLGGGLFMYYTLSGNYSKYGCWGAVHSFDDLDTPKYRALKALAK